MLSVALLLLVASMLLILYVSIYNIVYSDLPPTHSTGATSSSDAAGCAYQLVETGAFRIVVDYGNFA